MSDARVGLSIKLGALGGIIWGCFFAAYYSMLQSFKFAVYASTVCFILLVGFFLAWPMFIKALRKASQERIDNEEDEEEE